MICVRIVSLSFLYSNSRLAWSSGGLFINCTAKGTSSVWNLLAIWSSLPKGVRGVWARGVVDAAAGLGAALMWEGMGRYSAWAPGVE